jgi:hypothetical protein
MLDKDFLEEVGITIEHTVVTEKGQFFMDTADEVEAFVLGYMEGRASVSEDAATPPVAENDVYNTFADEDEDVVFVFDTRDFGFGN